MELAEHKSFLIYKDNAPLVNVCTDEQAGILFKALFNFACNGKELITDDGMLMGFYTVFRNAIVRDDEKYQERCRINSENGSKGGRPKEQNEPSASEGNRALTTASEGNRTQANKADMDIVKDRERVKDSDSAKGMGSVGVSDSDSDSESGRWVEMGKGSRGNPAYSKEEQEMIDAWNRKRQSVNIKYD